jgi:hypothetical protein
MLKVRVENTSPGCAGRTEAVDDGPCQTARSLRALPTDERDPIGSAIALVRNGPDDIGRGVVAVVEEDDLGRDVSDGRGDAGSSSSMLPGSFPVGTRTRELRGCRMGAARAGLVADSDSQVVQHAVLAFRLSGRCEGGGWGKPRTLVENVGRGICVTDELCWLWASRAA